MPLIFHNVYALSKGELSMKRKMMVVLTGFVLTLNLAGCASTPPERVLSTKVPTYASLPNGYNPLNPDQLSPMYATTTARG